MLPSYPRPAGFWRRLVSLVVDALLIGVVLYLMQLLTTLLMNRAIERTVFDVGGRGLRYAMEDYQISNMLASLALVWIYFAGFEASPLEGTPGKRLLGVRLMDVNGKRLAIWRSALRFVMKGVSAAPLMLGFLIAGMNRRRRGLHDMLSGSYAVVGKRT